MVSWTQEELYTQQRVGSQGGPEEQKQEVPLSAPLNGHTPNVPQLNLAVGRPGLKRFGKEPLESALLEIPPWPDCGA
ncbi:hypothetical protein SKAU_G00343770 [Synaphobranchus kaupii]|uniref:Uncharacterized protein n=1 Tax=Synaphobranchus kaupii TaxID=118154 RepID=A0A9Q1EJ62_SYNKA|nr:hypothetical protein SKAU_G00343770 [Synaphobranchus kaupii]